MKKILVIIAIIAIISGIGYIAWRYFYPDQTNTQTNENFINEDDLPAFLRENTLKPITNVPIFDYWINKNTGEIYYIETSGKISRITPEDEIQQISPQEVSGLNYFKPSFDGKYILISLGDLSNKIFSILDIEEDKWKVLGENTISADWSPNENLIASAVQNNSDTEINLIDPRSGKITRVASFGAYDLELNWILKDEIYLSEKPDSKFPGSILALNIKDKTLRFVAREEPGLIVKWFENGTLGIKSANNRQKNTLSLINRLGQVVANLDFGETLPFKCDIEEALIYCGTHTEEINGITMPDDYLKRKFYSKDNIISFDIKKNNIEFLFDGITKNIDIEKLTKQGNNLYLKNRQDGKLYLLEINEN